MFPAKLPTISQPPAAAATTSTSFITEWTVSGDETARTVTLPLYDNTGWSHGTLLDFTIDWGDGTAEETITAHDDADRVHIYETNGTYEVTMTGVVGSFKFNNGTGLTDGIADCRKLTKISNWGTYYLFIDDAFWGCSNLVITASDAPDCSKMAGNAMQYCSAASLLTP